MFSVADATNFRIFSVFRPGYLLYVNLSTLHPRTDIKGPQIRTAILIGQSILYIEVR